MRNRGAFAAPVAGLGSVIMLGAALGFQYVGGLYPCELCIWQRWPHVAAIIILGLWLVIGGRFWLWLGMVAALTAAALGLFHLGVEQGWWDFISSCTNSSSIAGESATALLPGGASDVAPPTRCDRIAWQLLGLSMAAWNMICSTVLAGIWLFAALRRGPSADTRH